MAFGIELGLFGRTESWKFEKKSKKNLKFDFVLPNFSNLSNAIESKSIKTNRTESNSEYALNSRVSL